MDNSQIDVIVGKQAFEQVGKLDKDLQELYKTYLKLFEVSQKMSKNPLAVKSTGEAKNRVKELSTNSERLNAVLKEQDRLEKALIRSLAKKELAQEGTNRALVREREEAKAVTLQLRNQERANSKLVGAYAQLTAKLNLLRREYKNVAVSEGEASEKAVKLRRELEKLDARVKSVDKSAGQFQRNVGNYPQGVSGMKQLAVGAKDLVRGFVGAFGAVEGFRLAWDFGKESLAIARQAKGVEFAFERLGKEGVDAFERVKKSTRGLLSDLDIKKSLVEFDNFNLSLAESDTLFEFLSVRAAQTGKSVDSLKDSLVEGLSKESKLRIDNLGISAAELNEELEKTPDFVQAVANIAKREVKEAGNILDEAGNGAEKWSAAMENVQVAFGKFLSSGDFNILGFLAEKLDAVADSFEVLDQGIETARIAINQFLEPIKEVIRESPFLTTIFGVVSAKLKSFIDLLFSPTFSRFGDFLTNVSYKLVGVGGVLSELINRFRVFKKELTDLSDLDFSNPVALFNSVKGKFNNALSQTVDITDAYTKAQEKLKLAILSNKDAEKEKNDEIIKSSKVTLESIEAEISKLRTLQKGSENRSQYLAFEKEIAELEKKRIAIIGVSNKATKKNDQLIKDAYALKKYLLEQEIELNDDVLKDEDAFYKERMNSLETFHDKTLELAELERDNNLRGLVEGSDAAKLVWEKYYNEVIGITKDYNSKLKDIQATPLEVLDEDDNIEEVDNTLAVRNLAEQLGFDPDMVLKEYEKFNDEMKRLYGEDYKSFTEFQELKKQGAEDVKEARLQFERDLSDGVQSIIDSMFQFEVQKYDDLIVANNDYYAKRLENQNLSEEERSQIEAERDAKNIELEKKRQEVERKAFLFKQGAAAAEIVIETVKAVAAIKAQAAILASNPATAPLAATALAQIPFVIGSGAVATAAVLGESVRAFKTGKKESDNYEGIALLNDGGRDEVRVDKYGNASLIQGRNVLSHVAKDDIIYPSVSEFNKSMGNSLMVTNVLASKGAKENELKAVFASLDNKIEKGISNGFKKARVVNHVHVNSFDKEAYMRSKMY